MCSLCGVLLSDHWAEADGGARARNLRVALLNRVLAPFGLSLGGIPPFRRVVVETTGLADPTPILATLLSEPVVRHHYEPERVIATVDAVLGLREEESLRQAVAADRLVVTKADLADAREL